MKYQQGICTFVCAIVLSACASDSPPAISGKMVAINTQPSDITTQSTPGNTPTTEASNLTESHVIYQGEQYRQALNRWIKQTQFEQVAWSIDNNTQEKLNEKAEYLMGFSGDISHVIDALATQLNLTLKWEYDTYRKIAAIHQYGGRQLQLVSVRGDSLSDALSNLTHDYQWHWNETDKNKSWLASNNYAFSSPYPLITPKGDIEMALQQVLEGYPISAQLLNSTRTVFIVDTK